MIALYYLPVGVESIFASEGKTGTSEDKVSASEAERCVETVTLMPEYLIVCCWRNVKEVSLLLGQLTFEAPITMPHTSDIGLLTVQQVLFDLLKVEHDNFTK